MVLEITRVKSSPKKVRDALEPEDGGELLQPFEQGLFVRASRAPAHEICSMRCWRWATIRSGLIDEPGVCLEERLQRVHCQVRSAGTLFPTSFEAALKPPVAAIFPPLWRLLLRGNDASGRKKSSAGLAGSDRSSLGDLGTG